MTGEEKKRSPQKYGYIRVSSADQNEARQIIEMERLNVPRDNLFIDKQSGKDFERAGYKLMMNVISAGDTLYILSIDRLGRDYREIQNQWRLITKEIGADICVIDMPLLDTRDKKDLLRTFVADIVLQILAYVSENEKNSIHFRQMAGIAAAKARGVKFGRPEKTVPSDFGAIVDCMEKGKFTSGEAIERSGMSRATFYRKLKEYRASSNGIVS